MNQTRKQITDLLASHQALGYEIVPVENELPKDGAFVNVECTDWSPSFEMCRFEDGKFITSDSQQKDITEFVTGWLRQSSAISPSKFNEMFTCLDELTQALHRSGDDLNVNLELRQRCTEVLMSAESLLPPSQVRGPLQSSFKSVITE